MSAIAERRKYILDSIVREGFVKVSVLAETFGVTQTTIRKDLNYLEAQGLLYRAYGSALPTTTQVLDITMSTKRLINFEAKQRIAEAAAGLIETDDSIIIASGSTVTIFAEALKPKGRLNVVSTAVNISAHLGDIQGITVMQVGGLLYSNTLSVIGAEANKSISNVYCSKAFIGVDGLDPDYGITCATSEEANLTQQIINSARKCVVLTDSSKLGKRGFARICPMNEIDVLITDSGLPEDIRDRFEDIGIKIIIA